MYCSRCGSAVEANAQFCPSCGAGQPTGPTAGGVYASPPAAFVPAPGLRAQTGEWIGKGWEIVKQDLGTVALLSLIFWAVNSVLSIVTHGPLTAGYHIVFMKKLAGRRAEIGDLFLGFNFFVPAFVAGLVISIFTFLGLLLCVIPGIVIAAIYMFTYLFIVDKKMDFWTAMKASHAVVQSDYFGFSIFLIAMGLVNLLGVLCCIVGLLVTMPISIAAITVAYQQLVGFEPAPVENRVFA